MLIFFILSYLIWIDVIFHLKIFNFLFKTIYFPIQKKNTRAVENKKNATEISVLRHLR